jgi:hypothetical protein
VGGRVWWIEINVDRENSENEEEEKGYPGTQLGSFHDYKKCPQSQEYQEEENQSFTREREAEMA